MKNLALTLAGIMGLTGVGLGAFGAHGLADLLQANGSTETWKTATLYHLVHALLLLGFALLAGQGQGRWLRIGTLAAAAGILVFSGSLYTLSLTGLKWLGAITPIGGLAFMTAWACLILHASKTKA